MTELGVRVDSALIVTRGQAANEAERSPPFITSTVGDPAYITASVSDRPFTSIGPGADKVMTQFPANDSNVAVYRVSTSKGDDRERMAHSATKGDQ